MRLFSRYLFAKTTFVKLLKGLDLRVGELHTMSQLLHSQCAKEIVSPSEGKSSLDREILCSFVKAHSPLPFLYGG